MEHDGEFRVRINGNLARMVVSSVCLSHRVVHPLFVLSPAVPTPLLFLRRWWHARAVRGPQSGKRPLVPLASAESKIVSA
eukprot:597744-Rhodomonas_salina.1